MNIRAKGTFPSDTFPTPRNDGYWLEILTRSVKVLEDTKFAERKIADGT